MSEHLVSLIRAVILGGPNGKTAEHGGFSASDVGLVRYVQSTYEETEEFGQQRRQLILNMQALIKLFQALLDM